MIIMRKRNYESTLQFMARKQRAISLVAGFVQVFVLCGIVGFWGLVGYVAWHFISKFW
jgi:hypothetical protein